MQYVNDTHSTFFWYAMIPVAYFTKEVKLAKPPFQWQFSYTFVKFFNEISHRELHVWLIDVSQPTYHRMQKHQMPGLIKNKIHVEIHVVQQGFYNSGFWLVGRHAVNQLDVMFEHLC